jgi:hypothetical protein
MRKWLTIAGGGLMVAACGGGGGGSDAVSVVPGTTTPTPTPTATPTPTPTATPTPTPTATPTPTPTSSYPRYADLTGSRTFQTACASLLLGGTPPTPQPAMPFGDGLTLDYGSTGSWAINGDGVALSFAASSAVTAPAGQRRYETTVGGSVQQFTITDPVAAGSTLDFVRSFALRTDRSAGSTLYSCVFGVPTTLADRPTAAVSYTKVAVNGTAYVAGASGTQTYVLTASTGTARYDATTNALVVQVHLLGYLQAGGSTATTTTDLGTFTGNGVVDATNGKFSGQLDSSDRVSLFSSFGGWFFGGTEAGAAFEVLAADPGTGTRASVVGTVVAAR